MPRLEGRSRGDPWTRFARSLPATDATITAHAYIWRAGTRCIDHAKQPFTALDAALPPPHCSSCQSAGRPLRQGPKGRRGGKSGLHGHAVPDNVRRGQPQGQCHRKQTAAARPAWALCAARVKWCGKSAPRRRQRRRHGKPHREQNRIGTARNASSKGGAFPIDVQIVPSG
jgi:hypothetical protein